MTSESPPFLTLRDGACEIYLIRHGDATPTESEVISATYDEQPLNARGRVQAEALARHLASVPFAALYSSARHPGQRIAVIAHGGVINVFAAEVLGLERDIFMAVPNTAVSRFRLQDTRRQLIALNDTCHLRELTRSTWRLHRTVVI